MDKNKRKQLLAEYKEIKTLMGIVKITNQMNGKIFMKSYPNLKNKWLTIQGQLNMGRFANMELQKDWNRHGSQSFTYEVLEAKKTDDITDVRWAMKQMMKPWLEKLQPFGDRGYNKPPRM
jgi:hypothetical protein